MESRSKLKMCRLCLRENGCFINVFEHYDMHNYIAAEVISDLLQFQVSETDAYPHVVCSTCLAKLTEFKLFKECCLKSKDTYDNMLVSHVSPGGHKPEMVEFVTVKENPICHSDDEDNVSKASNDLDDTDTDTFIEELMEDIGDDASSSEFCEEGAHNVLSSDGEKEVKGTPPENVIGGQKSTFECCHCKKVLKSKRGLEMHLAGHKVGTFFKCEVCDKFCASKSILVRHLRTHAIEKPYGCEECSTRFSRQSSLKDHMLIHSKLKPFKCMECESSFSRSSSLKRHMRCHSELRSYSCEVCHMIFRKKYNLTSHMKTHS